MQGLLPGYGSKPLRLRPEREYRPHSQVEIELFAHDRFVRVE